MGNFNVYRTFRDARAALTTRFKVISKRVETQRWQGMKIEGRKDMVTYELLNESMEVPLFGIEDLSYWQKDISPNLPWADDHFLERVSGAPLNPGVEWSNWPWASSADKHRTEGEMFNHTYAERLWPRHAALANDINAQIPLKIDQDFFDIQKQFGLPPARRGIREEYGDLGTLIDKMAWEGDSRQLYIPLYFPEDTGAEGRMPCTLGYQFIVRDKQLHIWYPLRSCDFYRHWKDDCYLAIRLLLWALNECRNRNPTDWNAIKPGTFSMHMTSLHIFMNDAIALGIDR